jgi:hypothetical protein
MYRDAMDRIRELEVENDRLNMEMVAYREKLTPKDVEAMTAVIKALTDEKASRSQSEVAGSLPDEVGKRGGGPTEIGENGRTSQSTSGAEPK